MNMPNRSQQVDVLRGLTMLYIVLVVHALFWLELFSGQIKSLLLFEMPVIFMLSGYSFYLSESAKSQKKSYLIFIVSRLSRVLVPYYLYVFFAVLFYFGSISHEDMPITSMLKAIAAWLNPFTFGTGYSVGKLNYHLWFIPIFLIVTALLPVAVKIRIFQPSLWLMMLIVAIVDYLFPKINYLNTNTFLSVIFYLIWALFGYHLAHTKFKYTKQDYLKVISLCLLLLIIVLVKRSDIKTLDMQLNKFPPNYIFFLFCCIWVSIFLMVATYLNEKNINLSSLHSKLWLKPFINHGYSIYLWQGIGCTLAVYLGEKFNFPIMLVWLIAIFITVLTGILAAPAEKIKIKFMR